jgi:chromosome partitioning protein
MKGGVGKSTLTVNLAWHFAAYRNWLKRVLVVDLDPQFNASQYLVGVDGYKSILDEGKPTIWDIFEENTKVPGAPPRTFDTNEAVTNVTTIEGGGRLDLIPSQLELALSLKGGPGSKERLLPRALKKLESDYDLILIDCAPTESILTTSAYLSSDHILVPVKPEFLSTIGLPLLVNSMQDFKKEYEEHNLELAGIVFNATTNYSPEESKSKREVKELAKNNGWYVFKSELAYSRSYPKGAREGQPIFRTSYARSDQSSLFRAFAQEFAERINL